MEVRLSKSSAYHHLSTMTEIAEKFQKEFPERVGHYDGVVYLRSCETCRTDVAYYAHRSKSGIIIVTQTGMISHKLARNAQ